MISSKVVIIYADSEIYALSKAEKEGFPP